MVKTSIIPLVFLVSALSALGQPVFTNVTIGTANGGAGDTPFTAFSKINYALTSISNNIATNSHKLNITNGTTSGLLTASNILGNVAGVINGKAPPFSMAGDDSTDDSTAFGTAKTRADALGQDIFLPSGTYIVGGLTWDADVAIHGVPGETILKLKAGSTNMFNMTVPQTRRWSGLTFDGNNANQSTNKSATIIHGYGAGQIFDRCSFINVENIAYNDFRMTTGVKFFDLYVSNVTCLATNAEYVNTVITIAPGVANTTPLVVFERHFFTNAPAADGFRQPGAFYTAGDDSVGNIIHFIAENGRVYNFGGNSAATGGASHFGSGLYDVYEDTIPKIRYNYDEGSAYISFKVQNSRYALLEGNITTNSSASSVYHISPGERTQTNGPNHGFTIRGNTVLNSTNAVAVLIDAVLSPVYEHSVYGNTFSNVLQGIRANGSSYSDGKGIKGPGYYGDNKIYSTGHNSFWFIGTDGRFILDNNDATVTGEASAFSAVSGNTNSTFQIIGGNYHAASGTAFNVKGVKALIGSGVRYSGATSLSLSQSSDGALVQRFKWDASNTEVSGTASITWADISDGFYEDFTSAGVLVRRLFPSGGIEIGYRNDTEAYRFDSATLGNYTLYIPKDTAGIANGIRLLNNTDTGGIRYAAGAESALGYFGTWNNNFATVGQQDKTGIEADSSASAIVLYAPNASQTIDFYSGSTTRAMQLNGANLSVTGSATANSFLGNGAALTLDASGFNGNLTTSDNTLQEVAQKLDDLVGGGSGDEVTVNGASMSAPNLKNGTNVIWHVDGSDIFGFPTNIVSAQITDSTIAASDLGTDSVSADELNATGVEAELEAVIDLQDLQGAVTDAQVPNTITVDLATTATTANGVANNSVTGAGIALASQAAGDIMYYDGTDWVRLAKGTAGQVLEMNAGATAPEWDTDDSGAGTTTFDALGDTASAGDVTLGHTNIWRFSLDGSRAITILGSDTDNASDTTLLTLSHNDSGDANSIFLDLIDDVDGTPVSVFKVSATAVTSTLPITAASFTGSGTAADSRVDVPDDDASHYFGFQANDTTTTSVNLIGPAAPFSGIPKFAVSATTNFTMSAAVANTDYVAPGGNVGAATATSPAANDDDTSVATTEWVQDEINGDSRFIEFALSDETTAITAGTGKLTWRAPHAMTITAVRASVTTAPTGATLIVDINESGTTILSTKLSIDISEKTSTTAASAAVISDTAIADDAEITFDFDQVGSTVAGAGVKVKIYYTK